MVAAIPNAIATAIPAPDLTNFPLLLEPLQSHRVDDPYSFEVSEPYWIAYRNYCDAWQSHWQDVGDKLEAALFNAGFSENRSLTHSDVGNACGGANAFINIDEKINGTDNGGRNILDSSNMIINSPRVTSKPFSFYWNANNEFVGSLSDIASPGIKLDTIALRSGGKITTVSSSATIPTADYEDITPGTLVLNNNPVSGGYIGWVYLGNGNWREFGAIS